MPPATTYDAILVGTSWGGRDLPIAFAQAGRRVALIERGHLGGTCVNVGCPPTKTMVAGARVAYLARRGADYGVHTGPVSVDMPAVRQRKQAIVEFARGRVASPIQAAQEATHGLDLLVGEARFVAPKTLEVRLKSGATQQIAAPLIVIDAGARRMQLIVRTPRGEQRLIGSHLLAAVGRVPNTEDLTPEAAGIEVDSRGDIPVNERLETSVPGTYALGDVKGGPAFTHVSYDDVRILRTNLLEHGTASTRDRVVPYTVFIDPQLARVALSATEARRQGRTFRVAKRPMSAVPRAIETGETRGFMKAVLDAETHQILGCAILGLEGGELMAIIQVATIGKLPYTALRDGVFTHPTLAEGLNSLFMTLG